MITASIWSPVWRPLWGTRISDRVMAILVDPNDGLALQAPTGEAWVQWITVS